MPYDRSAFVTRTALEDVAMDFMVDEATAYHADKLFTPVPTSKALSKITQMDGSKLRLSNIDKATDSESDTIDEQSFTSNITMAEKKLGAWVNPRDVRDADIPELLSESRKVKIVTNQLLIGREYQAAAMVTNTANYPAALTSAIAAGGRWNEPGGDPESDIITAQEAVRPFIGGGVMPLNALLIDVSTFNKLRTSPALRARAQYTQRGPLPQDLIQAYLGVDYLFISTGRYNAAVEGATANITGFYSTNAIAFNYNPNLTIGSIGFGVMALDKTPFWVDVTEDPKRRGTAGRMKRVEVGSEWALAPGFVESSASAKFAAGYLFRTVV